MSEEQVVDGQQQVAEVTAPATEVTATPAADVSTTPEATPAEPAKTFTQEELDAVVAKRLAREQRKWEREQVGRQQAATSVPPQVPAEGTGEPGQTPDVVALAEQLMAQREAQKRQAVIEEAYLEREEQAREKYDDFQTVAYNPNLSVTDAMALVIRESEIGPELIYHLGSNPAEAKRIAQLPPLAQAKELGKLEDKLAKNPPAKRTTSAPPPITPVTARGAKADPAFDTTDPRSIETMTTSEWIAAERQRQIRKLQAQTR